MGRAPRRAGVCAVAGVRLLLLHLLASCDAQPQGVGDLMPIINPLRWFASPWPYQCQAPIPLGEPCTEDYDCDPGDAKAGRPPHHCHLARRVCALGEPEGEACESAQGCAPGLGCKLTPPVMECYELYDCDAEGNNCSQGPSTGKPCGTDGGCAPGTEVCNMSLPPGQPAGRCAPLPSKIGEDCASFVSPQCGGGLFCVVGEGVCRPGGGPGERCPIFPDRCNASQGLVCLFEGERSFCGPARRMGQRCEAGGECEKGAFCDLHDLTCKPIRPAGSSCRNGNECGEQPFDGHIGVDCVRGSCVDTSRANANCWPNVPQSQCINGRVCRRTAAAAAEARAKEAKEKATKAATAGPGASAAPAAAAGGGGGGAAGPAPPRKEVAVDAQGGQQQQEEEEEAQPQPHHLRG